MTELASRCVGVVKFSSTYLYIRLQEFYYAALRETISAIFVKKAIFRESLQKDRSLNRHRYMEVPAFFNKWNGRKYGTEQV